LTREKLLPHDGLVVQSDFRVLVETAPDLIGVLDRDQRYVYVNAALERAAGRPADRLLGARADLAMPPDAARAWRAAIEDVLRTGDARAVEHTLETPDGPRRFAVTIAALPEERVCAVWRDVTDVRSRRLLEIAAQTMPTGMVIVEAPSGRILFMNEATERVFGRPAHEVRGKEDYGALVAFDRHGRRIASEGWPISRALAGEVTVGERVEVHRRDGAHRTVSINASPVRDARGEIIAAVSTYYDVTDARRAHEAASYLARAGALLERFDPDTTLQALADLAVPVLADWCFVHLRTAGHPVVAAMASADPARAAAARAAAARPRHPGAQAQAEGTALARVLAGGPRELVAVDGSAVVAPLAGQGGVLGAVTFAMAESGRRYDEADLEVLAELARRTGIALENARLFAAERQARRLAEEARDRMRRLQALTGALSGAVEQRQVVSIMVEAGRAAVGAAAGFAWLLRGDDTVELATAAPDGRADRMAPFRAFPMTARLPVCDAIRTGQPMMFESRAAMTAAYPDADAGAAGASPSRAWTVVPFVVGGRGVGAVSFSFVEERTFSDEDRELLTAMTGQASLALERCMLVEAERRARAEAEAARQRERELNVIAARLSSALTPQQVAAIAVEEVMAALRAYTGVATVRADDEVEILWAAGAHDPALIRRMARSPLATEVPSAEAIRAAALVWCESEAELAARYPGFAPAWHAAGVRAGGAVPFTFEGRAVGALAIGYAEAHPLRAEEREFLQGVGQLAAQALERARLYQALQASEEQLRLALTAGRAATWKVDLATMTSTRDPSYQALLGVREGDARADFGAVHPDDQAIARAHFERTLRDGVPYEPELRVRRDDGTYVWIRSHGRLVHDPDGAPIALAGVIVDIDEAKRASLRAEEERRINETLHRLGNLFASELDHDRLVHLITDEVAKLVGAELGEFCDARQPGARPWLVRDLAVRVPVRIADVARDPRTGAAGAPSEGRPAVRSFLGVPVIARSGEVFGSLRFGHPEAGRFTVEHERLAASIATQAAIALENARLYKTVREQNEQLALAVERVRQADRRKDEFLAMLGHELRNPLAPISTALELMSLRGGGALQKERDVIRRQVDHLSRLIDDLLDVSRITRGKVQLARQVIEIGAVLGKAIEMASPLLEKRMQPLEIDVPRAGLAVDADPTRLAQVFQNLLTNAAKYSEPRTPIALRARGDAARVIVEVRDRGIGIAADVLPRLFELFVQGARSLDRAQGGLGIGLTVARSLCELHGGTIEAASAGPGRGSTFTVILPRAARAAAAAAATAGEPAARAPSGMRVLVVDDNVDAAVMLRELLAGMGHEPAVAHDGLAALELATSFQPHVAVLDIGLPVMDGYELARKLRAQPGSETLRLIAVTGYGQDSDRARAREAGFDHHLIKPVALDVLAPLLDDER
jgi:PAS domain S-box-containing protein